MRRFIFSFALLSMAMSATADRKRGVIPWEKVTTEKTMTIYGAYDADKTIKFEFKAESGHDVYQVADLAAFNACDLTGATKMDEVCAFLRDDFFLCTCLSKRCLSDFIDFCVAALR
jgi:hypothetical protein